MQDTDFQVTVGQSIRFSKTVSESDVYLFAGITGDLSDVHCNEQYMETSAFGHRIAHGVLSMGFMSTASTVMFTPYVAKYVGLTPVSLGYDRVRFVGPVFFGDTVTVSYTIDRLDGAKDRTFSNVEVRNQRGEVVAAAVHIMKWVPVSSSAKNAA
ncbi:MaoC family dehydratase [Tardiphaga sp.]|uniref:MaoC family dehydratase n=1 Tax=Tardiphaga sp. TaxID=1926292 RepID=UPI0037DA4FB2